MHVLTVNFAAEERKYAYLKVTRKSLQEVYAQVSLIPDNQFSRCLTSSLSNPVKFFQSNHEILNQHVACRFPRMIASFVASVKVCSLIPYLFVGD
ncbi:hypothetical protein KY285_000795 [Solanum tuberosum]|nr:hypothetical protein KY285_000795 [Solanum tuberosum]